MAKVTLELLNNTEHWRGRAEEARVHAEQLTDPEATHDAEDRERLRQARPAWERRLRGES
jgi:hypothetical protein